MYQNCSGVLPIHIHQVPNISAILSCPWNFLWVSDHSKRLNFLLCVKHLPGVFSSLIKKMCLKLKRGQFAPFKIPSYMWSSSFKKLSSFQIETWKSFSGLHLFTFFLKLLLVFLNRMNFSSVSWRKFFKRFANFFSKNWKI